MKKLIILLTLFIVGCSSPTENGEQENNSDTNLPFASSPHPNPQQISTLDIDIDIIKNYICFK